MIWLSSSVMLLVFYFTDCGTAFGCDENSATATDIVLQLNCTTLTPTVTAMVSQAQDGVGILALGYNCSTLNNTILTGSVFRNRGIPAGGSAHSDFSSQLSWGAECMLSGCYQVIGEFEMPFYATPPASCTVQQQEAPVCSMSCGEHSVCNEGSCECTTGLLGDGLSCFNMSDCDFTNGGCVNCTSEGCACLDGFTRIELEPGLYTCRDIDECIGNNSSCEQRCLNTVGSYSCLCSDGYTMKNSSCTLIIPEISDQGSEHYHFSWLVLLLVPMVLLGSCFVIATLMRKQTQSNGIQKVILKSTDDDLINFNNELVNPKTEVLIEQAQESTFNLFEPQEPFPTTLFAAMEGELYHTLDQSLLICSEDQPVDRNPTVKFPKHYLNRSAPDLHKPHERAIASHASIPNLHCPDSEWRSQNVIELRHNRQNYDMLFDQDRESDYIVMSYRPRFQ